MKIIIIGLLLFSIVAANSYSIKGQDNSARYSKSTMYTIDDCEYWTYVSPLNFLDTLAKYIDDEFLIYCFPPPKWCDSAIITEIEMYVNDTTHSGFAISGADSFFYKDYFSTKGEQAQCLIQGIKNKLYPPTYWLKNMRKK